MNIPFLSLKDVTALHGAEINEAVSLMVLPQEETISYMLIA